MPSDTMQAPGSAPATPDAVLAFWFADAMRRAEADGRLTYVGIRHEGAASFAASAYGKLTGRPAACFAIAGPGSTNLLTGLYDARVDRSPVLAISGQVPSKVLGRGAFQDLDLTRAFADVAGSSHTVLPGSDHAELTTLACKQAIVGRQVSHLVLPDEVQVLPAPDAAASGPNGRVADDEVVPPAAALDAALDLLAGARRPVIVVGHGARRDMDAVVALADLLGAPVLTTFKAKGLISDHHPLGCGVLGRSDGRPMWRRPAFVGVIPSTSLSGERYSRTVSDRRWRGRGIRARTPVIVSSLLREMRASMSSGSDVSSGRSIG